MQIQRIQVEGGFLDRFDQEFTDGLNVLVGPRGSGKTSVIELIRFGLGIDAFTTEAQTRSREHVLSVLGDGQVTLTLRSGDSEAVLTRSASDSTTRGDVDAIGTNPILLSQGEIEEIALDNQSRLRLIDAFLPPSGQLDPRLRSSIASVTREMHDFVVTEQRIRNENETLREEMATLGAEAGPSAPTKAQAKTIDGLRRQVTELDQQSASRDVAVSVLKRSMERLNKWAEGLRGFATGNASLEQWPNDAHGPSPLEVARRTLLEAATGVTGISTRLDEAAEQLLKEVTTHETELARIHSESAALRRQLEELQEGAGAAARREGKLKTNDARIAANAERLGEVASARHELLEQRRGLLDQLEAARDERFKHRVTIARRLNDQLGPRIKVEVERGGLHADYVAAIEAVLRAGPEQMFYERTARDLASTMSPRELVEAAEGGDADSIAEASGLTSDRAQKVVRAINATGGEDVLAAPVEDGVTLSLLDGTGYKVTNKVSTGQRCTVVLPILLEHRARGLLIDQPEDHLDNRFIVDSVIKAIRLRPSEDQLIVATHNANIPVLGEASQVIVLASDGTRGFPVESGPLESDAVVSWITNLMEGGQEAFEARAEFYKARWSASDG